MGALVVASAEAVAVTTAVLVDRSIGHLMPCRSSSVQLLVRFCVRMQACMWVFQSTDLSGHYLRKVPPPYTSSHGPAPLLLSSPTPLQSSLTASTLSSGFDTQLENHCCYRQSPSQSKGRPTTVEGPLNLSVTRHYLTQSRYVVSHSGVNYPLHVCSSPTHCVGCSTQYSFGMHVQLMKINGIYILFYTVQELCIYIIIILGFYQSNTASKENILTMKYSTIYHI